jgi:hypothetical protein
VHLLQKGEKAIKVSSHYPSNCISVFRRRRSHVARAYLGRCDNAQLEVRSRLAETRCNMPSEGGSRTPFSSARLPQHNAVTGLSKKCVPSRPAHYEHPSPLQPQGTDELRLQNTQSFNSDALHVSAFELHTQPMTALITVFYLLTVYL